MNYKKNLKEILKQHKIWLESSFKQGKKANLRGADLSSADLSGAILPNEIPYIENIKSKIPVEKLNMDSWHSECGTVHCLAGWACHLANDKELEKKYTTKTLGALIFQKSCGEIPNFYSSDEEALRWLKS